LIFQSKTGKTDSFFKGLKVQKKDTGLFSIGIGTGFFKPGEQKLPKWDPKFVYLNIEESTIELLPNKETLPRFDYIVAKPDFTKQFDQYRGLRFYSKPGKLRQDVSEDITPEFPDNLEMDEILLGFVYNPGQGLSENSTISILSINKTEESFSYETQPSDLRISIINSLQSWETGHFYIKEQIVNKNLSLWYCKKTHASNIFQEDKEWYWEPIGGIGGFTEEQIIDIIKQTIKPAPPLHSIQFNKDIDNFGGSENLLWYNSLKELFMNGVLILNKQVLNEGESISTPTEGTIKLFLEEKNNTLVLKIKLENDREYIISSIII